MASRCSSLLPVFLLTCARLMTANHQRNSVFLSIASSQRSSLLLHLSADVRALLMTSSHSKAFTRNPEHCTQLEAASVVDGCSVVLDDHVGRDGYLTYCERAYLNPVTATGPNWPVVHRCKRDLIGTNRFDSLPTRGTRGTQHPCFPCFP